MLGLFKNIKRKKLRMVVAIALVRKINKTSLKIKLIYWNFD
jgi:hypothetical protein